MSHGPDPVLPLVLTIDVGPSSARCGLHDGTGRAVVLFDRVDRWLSLPDRVLERFSRRGPGSVSMAVATGLFDQHRLDWDGETVRQGGA